LAKRLAPLGLKGIMNGVPINIREPGGKAVLGEHARNVGGTGEIARETKSGTNDIRNQHVQADGFFARVEGRRFALAGLCFLAVLVVVCSAFTTFDTSVFKVFCSVPITFSD
jgi:hypothetical protein